MALIVFRFELNGFFVKTTDRAEQRLQEDGESLCRFVLKPATEPAYTKGSNSLKTVKLYDRREVILGRNRLTGLNDLTQEEDPHIIFVSRNHLKVEARDSSVFINPCCSQLNMVWVNDRKCVNG